MTPGADEQGGALGAIERFFTGWRFPALVLGVLGLFAAAVGAVLAIPPSETGLGAFALQFRVWCFGAADGGGMPLGPIVATCGEVLVLMVIVGVLWRRQLADQWRARRAAYGPMLGVSAGLVALLAVGFATLVEEVPATQGLPAHALRTELPSPRFTLTDQDGEPVALEGLRGRVVLVTAVYASCGLACPRILGQAKRAVAALGDAERDGLTVLGVTLDPVRDDVAALQRMAKAQRVEAPLYRLLTGEPAEVNRVLDALNVARARDEKTGVIDHVNVFILVDRQGRIAYRLGLGEEQERWLVDALRLLLAERPEALTAVQ